MLVDDVKKTFTFRIGDAVRVYVAGRPGTAGAVAFDDPYTVAALVCTVQGHDTVSRAYKLLPTRPDAGVATYSEDQLEAWSDPAPQAPVSSDPG